MLNPLNELPAIVEDLSLYLNVHQDTVRRFIGYAQKAMAPDSISVPRLWRWMYGHRPGTEDEHKLFYALNPLYLFDLANFAGEFDIRRAGAQQYMKGDCLDFGCGIGTVGLEMMMLEDVQSVSAVDISIISTDFLDYRVKREWVREGKLPGGKSIGIINPLRYEIRSSHLSLEQEFDFIYVRDVFEHIVNRIPVLDKILEHLNPDGVLCEASPIEGYDAETGHENVPIQSDGDIWGLLREHGFEKISEEPTGGLSQGTTKCWRKK